MRDRILELRRVRAGDLQPDKRNWRVHPPAQRRALSAMLEEVGIADAVIARETDEGLVLVDGHLRADLGHARRCPGARNERGAARLLAGESGADGPGEFCRRGVTPAIGIDRNTGGDGVLDRGAEAQHIDYDDCADVRRQTQNAARSPVEARVESVLNVPGGHDLGHCLQKLWQDDIKLPIHHSPCAGPRLLPPASGNERMRWRRVVMPKKEIITVEKIAEANPNLSLATRFGDLVFVAGQTGRHPATGELGKDVREQTRNTIERIKAILEASGSSLDNVLTATTHLTKREDLAAYNEEYALYFPTNKPARTTVEVMLNSPELLVEITVIACIES